MPTERQKAILNAVVREYVANAEPVASVEIVKKYDLPFSPATVRNEFLALDEAGYLTQPHTSAGRIPTDKGYRFFINNLTEEEIPRREEEAIREIREAGDPQEFIKQASRMLAHLSHNVAVAGFPDEELFYKSGIGEVMLEPEFSEAALVHEFTMLVDMIDEEIAGMLSILARAEFSAPQVFIGRENPIRGARHCGMIVSSMSTPFNKESMIALIGPKRMDYERNIAIMKHFQEILSQ